MGYRTIGIRIGANKNNKRMNSERSTRLYSPVCLAAMWAITTTTGTVWLGSIMWDGRARAQWIYHATVVMETQRQLVARAGGTLTKVLKKSLILSMFDIFHYYSIIFNARYHDIQIVYIYAILRNVE